ncbi:hypothetical protein FOA22_20005 [Heyndrickxia oleronia]|uniref:cysteine-rich VLP protein n=1 Tax=Heyndrickxia oleronia TaxID=38875 RepID=UPI00333D9A18
MEKDIKQLVTKSCANFIDGKCILLDRECPLLVGGEYRGKKIAASDCSCTYFEKDVLPSNKTVEAFYYGKETVLNKSCKGCGKGFNSVSNRSAYCSDICRKSARKKTFIKANQKRAK